MAYKFSQKEADREVADEDLSPEMRAILAEPEEGPYQAGIDDLPPGLRPDGQYDYAPDEAGFQLSTPTPNAPTNKVGSTAATMAALSNIGSPFVDKGVRPPEPAVDRSLQRQERMDKAGRGIEAATGILGAILGAVGAAKGNAGLAAAGGAARSIGNSLGPTLSQPLATRYAKEQQALENSFKDRNAAVQEGNLGVAQANSQRAEKKLPYELRQAEADISKTGAETEGRALETAQNRQDSPETANMRPQFIEALTSNIPGMTEEAASHMADGMTAETMQSTLDQLLGERGKYARDQRRSRGTGGGGGNAALASPPSWWAKTRAQQIRAAAYAEGSEVPEEQVQQEVNSEWGVLRPDDKRRIIGDRANRIDNTESENLRRVNQSIDEVSNAVDAFGEGAEDRTWLESTLRQQWNNLSPEAFEDETAVTTSMQRLAMSLARAQGGAITKDDRKTAGAILGLPSTWYQEMLAATPEQRMRTYKRVLEHVRKERDEIARSRGLPVPPREENRPRSESRTSSGVTVNNPDGSVGYIYYNPQTGKFKKGVTPQPDNGLAQEGFQVATREQVEAARGRR